MCVWGDRSEGNLRALVLSSHHVVPGDSGLAAGMSPLRAILPVTDYILIGSKAYIDRNKTKQNLFQNQQQVTF